MKNLTDDEKGFYLMLCGWESVIAISECNICYIPGERYWSNGESYMYETNYMNWFTIDKAYEIQRKLELDANKR